MQGRVSFKLILQNWEFEIPIKFRALHDVEPTIYQTLITRYQYVVKSNVNYYIMKSFIDHWVKNKIPCINSKNISLFEQLSEEFDRMKDLINLIKSKQLNLSNLTQINANKLFHEAVLKRKSLVKKMKSQFQLINQAIFNCGELNSNFQFPGVHRFYFDACKDYKVSTIMFLSNKIVENNNLLYVLNEKEMTASLYKSLKDSDDIFIPRSIKIQSNEYIITSIYKNAFLGRSLIKTVRFGNDSELKVIGSKAFYNSSLEQICIPSSVTKISKSAFSSCANLVKIDIPINSNLIYIDKKAFAYSPLIEYIFIPKHVKSIGFMCFINCGRLRKIEFSNESELKIIRKAAFTQCGVENIRIPSHVSVLEPELFWFCKDLKKVEFSEDSKLSIIKKNVFYRSSIESLTIPSGITEMKYGWCEETNNLNEIKILQAKKKRISCYDNKFIIGRSNPKSDKYDSLLFAPRNIEVVMIPSFIKQISSYAFNNCKKITKISFPKDSKLKFIGDCAFLNCEFEKITFPSCIEEIGQKSFINGKLKKVIFPKNSNLKIIEMQAFSSTSLKKIIIPSKTRRIGKESFSNCKKLQSLQFEINSELEIIDTNAFMLCSIKKVSIPCHVKKIYSGSFYRCVNLRRIIFLENSELKELESYIFYDIPAKKICIPSSIEKLNDRCFNCINITDIEISKNNKNILLYKNIFILQKSVNESEIYDILVLAEKNIKKVLIPSFVKTISSNAFADCVLLESVEFSEDSQLTRIGDNSFCNTSIRNIKIPKSVICIAKSAFMKCSKLKYIEFHVDSKLEEIEYGAFEQSSIECIKIPSHVKSISPHAFYYCKQLKTVEFTEQSEIKELNLVLRGTLIENIYIPPKIESISSNMLGDLRKIKNIKVSPKSRNFTFYNESLLLGKKNIKSDVFNVLYLATGVDKIIIPPFIKEFGAGCSIGQEIEFTDDSQLERINENIKCDSHIKSISIPSSVRLISKYAFINSELEYITFKENSQLECVEDYAFAHSAIRNIFIPSNVKSIGNDSFDGCYNLKIIEFGEKSKLYSFDFLLYDNSSERIIMVPCTVSSYFFKLKSFF